MEDRVAASAAYAAIAQGEKEEGILLA